MVLYHVNLGWPLLDEGAQLQIPARSVTPRDSDAAAGLGSQYVISAPTPHFREQVFIHEASEDRFARLVNPARRLALTIRHSETLPTLFEWKMTATKHYVLGLEPANTSAIHGRAQAREEGRLPVIEPGETVTYQIEIEVERT